MDGQIKKEGDMDRYKSAMDVLKTLEEIENNPELSKQIAIEAERLQKEYGVLTCEDLMRRCSI